MLQDDDFKFLNCLSQVIISGIKNLDNARQAEEARLKPLIHPPRPRTLHAMNLLPIFSA